MAGGMDDGGRVWQGAGGHAWQRACVVGGVCGMECAWQERRLLQRMVRILLECILVHV